GKAKQRSRESVLDDRRLHLVRDAQPQRLDAITQELMHGFTDAVQVFACAERAQRGSVRRDQERIGKCPRLRTTSATMGDLIACRLVEEPKLVRTLYAES